MKSSSGWNVSLSLTVAVLLLPNGLARAEVGSGAAGGASEGSHAIAFEQLGAAAVTQYHGDGLAVRATADGARLRCSFQNLDAQATQEGLWLASTVSNQLPARFCLRAAAVGREGGEAVSLAVTGDVRTEEHLARWIRPGLTEVYTVSVDGVRQDFLVPERPAGAGALRLELALSGAQAEPSGDGVQLVLDGSGRKLVYNRLQAVDAKNHALAAHFTVQAANRLAVVVDDGQAVYPVRIDPTYSDANWTSMGGVNGVYSSGNTAIDACVVDSNGNVYVGGSFSAAGSSFANNVAKWDGNVWSPLGPGMNGNVHALALDVAGNLCAGGDFTTAGGVAASYIARWNGTVWSAMGSGMDNSVYALVVDGTNLYAGGYFNKAGGNAASGVAKWDGSGWSAVGSGIGGIWALALDGAGNLYAGGDFSAYIGTNLCYNLAKWDGAAWSALGGGGPWSPVRALAVNGTDLYVGGEFTQIKIASGWQYGFNYLARWNGSEWSTVGSGVNNGVGNQVYSLTVDGSGNLYVGGGFSSAGGVAASGVAKWDGTVWSALGAGVNSGGVNALAVSGTNLYAGGVFYMAGGQAAGNFARWNGSAWAPTKAELNSSVYAMVFDGAGNLYAGGNFTSAGGSNVNHVARWSGSAWTPLGSGMNDAVNALVWDGSGNLYAGGAFTNAGGIAASHVAKWDGSTWSPLGSGMNWDVYALAVNGTRLYAGGFFSTAGGSSAKGVAMWDGSVWSALGAGSTNGVQGEIYALAINGTDLYVGGLFNHAGGNPAINVAKWDGSAWSALVTQQGGVNDIVFALVVSGNNLYAGGSFVSMNGVVANDVARWNGSAWSALGSGVNGSVRSLLVSGNTLYAGSFWQSVGGNAVKWDGSAWSPLASSVDGAVLTMALDASTNLYVGGAFTLAGGKVSPFAACLLATTMPVDTVTAVSAYPNPVPYGQVVNVVATVTNVGGATTPWGNVVFLEAGTSLSTNALFGSDPSATALFCTTNLAFGSHTLTAAFAGNGNFNGSTGTCAVTIGQGYQTIAFSPIAEQVITNHLVLRATASSGLPVSFAVASGPATISDDTNLSFTGGGAVAIVASQAGNSNYYPAPPVTNTFNVRSLLTLTIVSDHGTTTPAPGVHTNLSGAILTNSVTSPVMLGSTQYVCTGWTLAGNDPGSGQTNTLTMTQTNNAVLTWLWSANPPPALSVSPPALDFGTVVVGQSTSLAFSVVNTGGQTLTGSAGVGWPYSIVPGSETYRVPPGHTGTVWVNFTPPYASPFSATVTFNSNGGSTNCAVGGNAVWPGWLRVNANDVQSIDFGIVATGTTAQASFSLINWGDVTIHVTVAQPDAPFAILSDTSFDLAGWETTNVVVGFTPPNTNSYSANIEFSSDGGNSENAVTGSGGYALVIQSTDVNCTPPPGTYAYAPGTVITNTAIGFVIDGNSHYVCAGWSMTGNDPVSGIGTSVVMTVTNDAVLAWIWTTNYWYGEDHTWIGASASSDSIDDPDNWANEIPNPGDNVRLDAPCVRQRPLSARGADSYFGEITVGYGNPNGMTWCGDKTRLLLFGNGNWWYGNTLTSEADLANRIWPASDLQINPWAGGIIVSNVDIQDGMQLQVYGGNTLTVNGALSQSGNGDATLAILEGATVILTGPNTLAGGISAGTGTLQIGNGDASGELGLGPVASDGTLIYNRCNAQTWANVISGLGGVTKRGAGALTLSGANGYAGGLRIEAGLVLLGNSSAIPDHSALILAGGALDLNGQSLTVSSLAGTGGVITNSGAGLTVDQIGDTTFGGGIAGAGSLIKTNTGILSLAGGNTYSGETRIEGGTLRVTAGLSSHLLHRWSFNGDLGDSAGGQTATIIGGSDVSPTVNATQVTLPGGDRNSAGYLSLGSGILPNAVDAPATIELWATQQSVQWWSRIFDFGGDTGNYLEMSWTAGDDINSDLVEVAYHNGAWNATEPYDLGVEYHIALVITPGAGDNGQTLLQWFKMDAAGNTLRSGSMSEDWTLADLVQDNMWLGVDKWGNACANASYNEVRIWDVALTESQLAANSVLGPDALPPGPRLPAATAVTISNGSVLELSSASDQTVASLASTDGLRSQVMLGHSSLAVGNDASTVFDGVISGPGALIKRGSGSLTLTGVNTYTGPTVVSNGTLWVRGALMGRGDIAIAAGATLGGTFSSAVTSDGTLVIGDDRTIETLPLPTYEQHAGATLSLKIGGATSAGFDYDQLYAYFNTAKLDGTLHVTVVNGYTPALGDTFTIVQSGGDLIGAFAAVDAPALPDGLSWYVTYESNTATLHVAHRIDQAITFDPIADQTWDSPLTLQATASSGLPVSFTVLSGPATLADGSNVTFTAAGTVTIVATQPGNIDYWPAPPVTNTFHAYGYFTLTIVSAHGTASPAPGDYPGISSETVLTNHVTGLEIVGNTHYTCTGWTLSGTIPASGSGTSMVMSVASDCVLTWLWATNYWNDTVQYWTGEGATADTIDQGDNWSGWSPPNPGDNLNFSNTTGSRHTPTSNYGADSYFGNLISYDGAGGIAWCGDKTRLLSFENNSDANPLVSLADLSNRTGPDSDLAINPIGSGGVTVSNVDIQNGMTLQINGANALTVNGALTQSGSGNASLAMHGGGTVILNGSNTLAGGTWIDTGTLQIGTGGTSGELGFGSVIDDGTLIYDRCDAQTWTNGISGTGSIEKLGAGTLTLGGENTYAGETRIAGGTLHLLPGLSAHPPHLLHRWSFNGDLRDSVGGQAASIVTGSDSHVTWDASQVTMPGGGWDTSDYISLGANILPNTADAPATIELWATERSVESWSRVFDFGNGPANYLEMTWSWNDDPTSDQIGISDWYGGTGGESDGTMAPYSMDVEWHIAMVIIPGAGDGGQTLLRWYKMDAAGHTIKSGAMSTAWTLARLDQVNMWLGASQYGDPRANASYNEVRIWDVALTEAQLAANSVLGPDALPGSDTPYVVAPLPPTTTVTLSNGGALDLGDVTNQTVVSIASTDGLGSQLHLGTAGLDIEGDGSATFDGVISGFGGLTKHGSGMLTLSGANTYGGATKILGGTLQIGDGGTSGALGLGAVIDDGMLIFDRSGSQTWGNAISGTGDLDKKGDGTLTLDGASTYGGETRIEAGTLQLLPATSAHLVHRWSFNGDLGDSVGGQTAVIVAGTDSHATTNATQVTLPGGNWDSADYVALGANLLPDTYAGVTIELWASQLSVQSWSRIFDFGNDPWNHVMMSWSQGGDPSADRVEVSGPGGGYADNTMASYELGVEYHIAMVITPDAGTGGHRTLVQWYKMDAAGTTLDSGSMRLDWSLANLAQNNMWLGAPDSYPWWSGDQNANASYDEVRIWDTALSEAQLAANSVLGPDVLPAPATLPPGAPLPAGTVVTLSNGGALELSNGVAQTVASIVSTDGLGSQLRLDDAVLAVGNEDDATFDGVISGDGTLIKRGDGTLTLTGANTCYGDLVILAGAVQIGDGGTSGALGLDSIFDDSALIYNRSDAQTWSNVIVGVGSFEKRGDGTLTLAGANTYAGGTRIAGGTLLLETAKSSHLLHRWSFNGDLGDAVGGQAATIIAGADSRPTLDATQVTLPGGDRAAAGYVSLGANILPNTATAPVTIELWATQLSVQPWGRIFDFGGAWWNYLAMAWNANGDIDSDYVEVVYRGSSWDTLAPYTLGQEFHIAMVITPGAGDGGQTLLQWYKMDAVGNVLSNSMSLAWTLADLAQNNMWLGVDEWGNPCANASYNEVRIWDCALTEAQLAANSVLGPNALPDPETLPLVTPLPPTTTVTLSNGGVLDLGNVATQLVASIGSTDASGTQIKLEGGTLVTSDDSSQTFDGVISGPGALIKQGAGTLTLTGSNTYDGGTVVDNGTLLVDGSIGTGGVTVAGGATLGGIGVVNGTVVSDGTVAPGDSTSVGILGVTNYAQHGGATLSIRLGGTQTAGTDYDQLNVSGIAVLGGALQITLTNGCAPTADNQFVVLLAASGVNNAFSSTNLPPLGGDLVWRVTYDSTSVRLQPIHAAVQSSNSTLIMIK